MKGRKKAFVDGLRAIRAKKARSVASTRSRICAIAPSLYNAAGMPDLNQIIQGDSIEVLNAGPEGWVDLCFADPPLTSATSIMATTTSATTTNTSISPKNG